MDRTVRGQEANGERDGEGSAKGPGIEPWSAAWQASVLPDGHCRQGPVELFHDFGATSQLHVNELSECACPFLGEAASSTCLPP